MYDERTRTEAELKATQTATTQTDDPTLLDELPITEDIVTTAPDGVKELIYAAFDIRVFYRKDQHQVTIRAVLTPSTLAALINDPAPTTTPTQAPRHQPPPAPMLWHS